MRGVHQPWGLLVYRKSVAKWHPCSSHFRVRWMHCQGGANWQKLLSSAPTRKLLRFQVSLAASLVLKLVIVRHSIPPLSPSPLPSPPSLPPPFPSLLPPSLLPPSLPLPPSPPSPVSLPDPIPVLKQGVMHHQKLMQAQDFEIENRD